MRSCAEAMRQRKERKGAEQKACEEEATAARVTPPHISLGVYAKLHHKVSKLQHASHRSTAARNGWWHTEDLKIYEVVAQRGFWVAIWRHLMFPAVWLMQRPSLLVKLKKLGKTPRRRNYCST